MCVSMTTFTAQPKQRGETHCKMNKKEKKSPTEENARWPLSPSTLMTGNIVSFYFQLWLPLSFSLPLSHLSVIEAFESLSSGRQRCDGINGGCCYCLPVSCSIDSLPSPIKPRSHSLYTLRTLCTHSNYPQL